MSGPLLPAGFGDAADEAVQRFWDTRRGSSFGSQGGTRGAVISGKNMDGFVELTRTVARHCGLPDAAVHTRQVTLPGYFRPTKDWDVLVVWRSRLLAALEFKSQVGSFGNNFNNRSEEVVGAAADLWAANRHGAFRPPRDGDVMMLQESTPLLHPEFQADPRPPFLGWLMLLEDSPRCRAAVRVTEPHYPALPEFHGASYAQRYRILCERLMSRQLYARAAVVMSPHGGGARGRDHSALSEATSMRSLFTEFAARMLAAVADDGG